VASPAALAPTMMVSCMRAPNLAHLISSDASDRLTASSNQAISYCTWLDGRASTRFGTRGSVAFDGVLTFAGIGLVGLMLLLSPKKKDA